MWLLTLIIANLVNKEFWIPINVSQLCINDLWYWYTRNVSVILILILFQKCIMILDTWYIFFVSRYVSWYMYHWYSPTLVPLAWKWSNFGSKVCFLELCKYRLNWPLFISATVSETGTELAGLPVDVVAYWWVDDGELLKVVGVLVSSVQIVN